ncbi:MAG: glycoside hydrolase family 16 protein [Puniceicoccales bacterium]|jgi:beta-glucanase (GH16 family)|nr:glycoside hydrolase family 16 protein [Puniceicoccales bacterium]
MLTRALFFALLICPAIGASAADTDKWELVWNDEFNATDARPDPIKWNYEEGRVRNKEAQYYTRDRRENARVENGKLILEARKEAHKGAQYTSASITTQDRFAFTYGRIEIRAKTPTGKGTWPALWMLRQDRGKARWPDSGEIDIMEQVGHDAGTIYSTIHTGDKTRPNNLFSSGGKIKNQKPWEDFHVYTMEWTPDRLDFYFDETKVHSYLRDPENPQRWPFTESMYLIMNIAIGGTWGGAIDDAVLPARMEIDWVRIYRSKTPQTVAPTAPGKTKNKV